MKKTVQKKPKTFSQISIDTSVWFVGTVSLNCISI